MADQLTFYQYHLPWSEKGIIDSPEKLKDMYVTKTGSQQIFTGNPYPLTAAYQGYTEFSKVPSTLPTTSGGELLANITSPAAYDDWLQNLFDDPCSWYEGGTWNEHCCPIELRGVFMYTMKHGNSVSKLCNIPFIALLQAHQVYNCYEVEREPTNEELDVMTNIAVSYGAKGIIYYNYVSFHPNDTDYNYGILDIGGVPRYTNMYGQPKWEKFKQITHRLKTWGPSLMSFNNTQTNSYIYRLGEERTSLLDNTYFKDIVTYKPGSGYPICENDNPGGSNPPGMIYECYDERYVQAAVFKNTGEVNPNYFMIVNRRCSPVMTGYPDGKRFIRVSFDPNSPSFPVYRTWKILDIGNDRWSQTFDKTTGSLIDLGEFNPGEGRLYKVVPVL